MPDRSYAPRVPPTMLDRIVVHWASVVIGCWWFALGLAIFVVELLDVPTTSQLMNMPPIASYFEGVALMLAGGGAVWSFLTTRDKLKLVWDVQQSAYLIGFGAWAAYTWMLSVFHDEALVSLGHTVTMMVIAAGELTISKVVEARSRQVLREQGELA